MNAKVDFGGEEAVVGLDVDAVDVDAAAMREDACDLMQDAYAVEADDVERGWEGELSVGVPVGCHDPVAASCLEPLCYFALALVDDDVSALVEEAEDVVAGDGMAGVAHDIAVDGFFVEDEQRFLASITFISLFTLYCLFITSVTDGEALRNVFDLARISSCENEIFTRLSNICLTVSMSSETCSNSLSLKSWLS